MIYIFPANRPAVYFAAYATLRECFNFAAYHGEKLVAMVPHRGTDRHGRPSIVCSEVPLN
jgi:hypothetical protein